MRRDFLKNLGVEDKELIDKILDENSSDIGRAKGDLETYKNKVTTLEGQIDERDKTIKDLQAKADSIDGLNEQITNLTSENQKLNSDLTNKVSALQKNHAIESGVRDAKAKNVKAVMALLDMEKITFEDGNLAGLNEQLEGLQKGDDTSFLFSTKSDTPPAPSGTKPSDPPSAAGGTPPTSTTLAEAIGKALANN